MDNKQKISWIGVLMGFSIFLLTLFVGYWLRNQYIGERIRLHENIQRGLSDVEEEVLDSILLVEIINPMIDQQVTMNVQSGKSVLEVNTTILKAGQGDLSQVVQNLMIDTSQFIGQGVCDTIITIENTFVTSDIKQSPMIVRGSANSEHQMLNKSIQLLIEKFDTNPLTENSVDNLFARSVDTLLLIQSFDHFIDENYSTLNCEWRAMSEEFTDNHGMIFKSELLNFTFGVDIRKYQFFLLKSIRMQLIFALVLLLMKGLSFRLSYKNMKRQFELVNMKNDFISNISHELKTPVSTVKVALEALIDFNQKDDPKRTKEYLEMASVETDRLNILVNKVLNNSALQAGQLSLKIERINVIDLLEEVLLTMKIRISEQNANVRLNHRNEPIIIQADKLHLHGALLNLIDNSLKYKQGPPVIDIFIEQDPLYTTLSVSDNGIGIPDAYLGFVFDQFFRVPKGEEHNVKGYGIGLNYAALVVEKHGGTIKVKNNSVSGCCFTIKLLNEQLSHPKKNPSYC